jgi:DNA-binding CsgD family transcriptional regulator/PAS domain-containing protein
MLGLEGVSVQMLSDTIAAIYDCALNPQQWVAACRRIADLCGGVAGGIYVHDVRQKQDDRRFAFGYEPEFLEEFEKHYAQSPMAGTAAVGDVGDVSILSVEQSPLLDSRFYQEQLKPFGLHDMIWLSVIRTPDRTAFLHVTRADAAAEFSSGDVSLFNLLSPHVCRALAISDALDIKAVRSDALERTLDALVAGVYLTSPDGSIVYMNAAAERQIKVGGSLRIVGNRVFPADAGARDALARAIGEASRNEAEGDMGEHSLAIPDVNGTGYIATLLPVARGERIGFVAPIAASVAVFIQDPVAAPLMPGEAFARLHHLTGAELRVVLSLGDGLSGKEAADLLGVSEPTVRTHLQRIFSKTNTTRQGELLRLLQNSTPAIRALPPKGH